MKSDSEPLRSRACYGIAGETLAIASKRSRTLVVARRTICSPSSSAAQDDEAQRQEIGDEWPGCPAQAPFEQAEDDDQRDADKGGYPIAERVRAIAPWPVRTLAEPSLDTALR